MAMLRQRLARLGYSTRDKFHAREAARILCMSDKQIYALVEDGSLDGVIDIAGDNAKQASLRFPIECIENYWRRKVR